MPRVTLPIDGKVLVSADSCYPLLQRPTIGAVLQSQHSTRVGVPLRCSTSEESAGSDVSAGSTAAVASEAIRTPRTPRRLRRLICAALLLLGCSKGPANSPGQVVAPRAADLVVALAGEVKLELVLVQPGEFMMCDGSAAHREHISAPYYLGRYEVTEEQWTAVTGAAPPSRQSDSRGARLPVQHMTFTDCVRFVDALNAQTVGGRFMIPTEAQWEYACRAGSASKWCFGDDESALPDYAWYSKGKSFSNGTRFVDAEAHPVGTKRPNAWGFFDMHGNVSEWCADPWRLYSDTLDGNGHQFYVEDGDSRVIRGGSYTAAAADTRCSVRAHALGSSDTRLVGVGFRVGREAGK